MLICFHDLVANACRQSMNAAGYKSIPLAGLGGTCQGFSNMLKGRQDFTVAQFLYSAGDLGVRDAVAVLDGKAPANRNQIAPMLGVTTQDEKAILAGTEKVPPGLGLRRRSSGQPAGASRSTGARTRVDPRPRTHSSSRGEEMDEIAPSRDAAPVRIRTIAPRDLRRYLQTTSIFVALALLWLVLSFSSPYFFTTSNIYVNILLQSSVVGILAAGFTLVLISGEIDLSFTSVSALAGVVAAVLIVQDGVPLVLGIILVLCVGAAAGLVNAYMTVIAGIPSFIATLAMLGIAQGLAYSSSRERRPFRGSHTPTGCSARARSGASRCPCCSCSGSISSCIFC